MLPLICLNFGTLNSAKDKISTKNAINSVAISAKVAIHAGAPFGGHSSHSCSSSSLVSSFFLKVDFFGKLLGGHDEAGRGWILYPALVLIGFYGGFIQVGVGLFIMAALYHLMGASLAKVNAHKVIVVLIYTIPAILIFFLSGNISWFIGICLAAGNSVGGWFGATVSVRGGEKYIRMALVVAVGLMALKLLGVF